MFTDGYGKQTRDILDVRESTCYMLDEYGEVVISNDCNNISYYAILTAPADWDGWSSSYTGDIVIPEKVTYNDVEYPVTSIDNYSFYDSQITSLTIPNSIPANDIYIWGCDKLNKVKANVNWIYKLESQFTYLNVKELHFTGGYIDYIPRIPSVEVLDLQKVTNSDLGQTAFAEFLENNNYVGFKNIRKLVLPENLWIIRERQFDGLWMLEEIVIPDGVTEIPDGAFYDCHALAKVEFSENLTSIGKYAFYSCHALENIVIPEGVTEIGDAAFYGCNYADEIVIASSVQRIGNNAFALCNQVERMEVHATIPPSIKAKTFYQVNRNIEFVVPTEARNAYAEDIYWREFIQEVPTDVETTTINSLVVYTQGGMIYVEGVETDYNIFDAFGRLIYTGRESVLSLPRGVYVVAIGDKIKKVVL